jgi:hypothetical protein
MNPRGISNNEFVFRTLWVLAVSFVGWFLLFVPGLVGGDFIKVTYPTAIGWRIGLITVFMIVGVVFDLIIYRGRKASTLMLPGLLLIVLTLLMFTLSGPLIQFIGSTGGAAGLWAFKVGGVLALIFNGWLVWRIWSLGDKDSQLVNQEGSVQRLEAAFATAEAAYIAANGALTTQRDTTEKNAKDALDQAEDAEAKAAKALPKAQEKFDNIHKAPLALKEQNLKDAKDDLKLEQGLLDNFDKNKANQALKIANREKYDRKRQKLEDNVNVADTNEKKAKLALSRAQKAAEATREGRSLKRAKDKLEAAQAAFIEAQNTHTGAQAATKTAEATFEGAKTNKVKRENELKGAREGLTAHQARASTALRGWWFGTVILLICTWVLYSSWYGWVLNEFGI